MGPSLLRLKVNSTMDAHGLIDHIVFYEGAKMLGTDSQGRHRHGWFGRPAGKYLLTAVAVDGNGRPLLKDSISVTVVDRGARPAQDAIQAEDLDGRKSTGINAIHGYYCTSFASHDYARYSQVDFGKGAKSFVVNLRAYAGFKNELRIDSPTGPVIGMLDPGAGSQGSGFKTVEVPLTAAVSGQHDFYIMMSPGNPSRPSDTPWIDWFRFGGVQPARAIVRPRSPLH